MEILKDSSKFKFVLKAVVCNYIFFIFAKIFIMIWQ